MARTVFDLVITKATGGNTVRILEDLNKELKRIGNELPPEINSMLFTIHRKTSKIRLTALRVYYVGFTFCGNRCAVFLGRLAWPH